MLIGLVGKPSSGKSTFFKALTLIEVETAPYPFTTIKPNHGVGFIKTDCVDSFFKVQCNPRHGFCMNHKRFVPVELMDVAGLVPGAHLGKGLGNQFLDDLRKADALIHVVDASGSTDAEGKMVQAGSYDPCNDILFLEEEINLWLQGIIEKNFEKIKRIPVRDKKQLLEIMAQQLSGLGIKMNTIESTLLELNLLEKNLLDWSKDDYTNFTRLLREKAKPIIIAANKIDLKTAKENLKRMKEKFPDKIIIGCSAETEVALKKAHKSGIIEYMPGEKDFKVLKELTEEQKKALDFIKENVLSLEDGTGVQKILDSIVFDILGCVAVFPGGINKLADSEGRILPDCFLMEKGSTVLDFAFKLHTDIGKNFIKAIDVKTKQLKGKDALLQNGDVIEIIFKK